MEAHLLFSRKEMNNIKNIALAILTGTLALLLGSCAPDLVSQYAPLELGDKITEVTINRQVERKILMLGGDGKYQALVEDARIAQVTTSLDTLKIKGVLEGETFAVIHSHDQSLRVRLRVVYPELTFSVGDIRLYPQDRSKFVSLIGGDEYTSLTEVDEDDIIDFKWDANTNLVEINAHYEGTAKLVARTKEGKELVLNITVKAEDEPQEYGIYETSHKFLNNNQSIANRLFVHRPGVGIWLSSVASPLGGYAKTYTGSVLKIEPILEPEVGKYIELNISEVSGPRTGAPIGKVRVLVEKKQDGAVLLRGKRHKFYLPYDTQLFTPMMTK